jgi:aromatic-L-amino-acid decarboxylase
VAKITEDKAAGHLPFCVVANAGTVATGACDPLAEISEVARRFGLWMHVDASYGGFGALAQSARPLFVSLKEADSVALGQAIEKDLACARYLEELVRASDDFEMLAPVELSIFCFRYVPLRLKEALARASKTECRRIEQELDALNERLLVALQRDGSSYLSNARLGGRFSLRGCVMNFRTTIRDMEILLDDLRRVARSVQARAARD